MKQVVNCIGDNLLLTFLLSRYEEFKLLDESTHENQMIKLVQIEALITNLQNCTTKFKDIDDLAQRTLVFFEVPYR